MDPEQLKNMTPEQIQEYQKQNCIFCHIVSGKVQSKKIYEDEVCISVLDINPANPGHMLLLPKEHHQIMPQVPDEQLGHMFMVAKWLSQATLKALGSTGTVIFIANGSVAGQKAQHFMAHVIPKKANDGVDFEIPSKTITEDDYEEVRRRLAPKIKELLGYSAITVEAEAKQIGEEPVEQAEEKSAEDEEPETETVEKVEVDATLFVRSKNSNKYHLQNCPFAQNIKEENKIFLKSNELDELEPCDCVSGEGIEVKKVEAIKKDEDDLDDFDEDKEEGVDTEESGEQEEEKGEDKESDKEDKIDLDDIAKMLGGG